MAKDLKLLSSEDGLFYGTFNDIVIENHDMLLCDGKNKIAQDVVKIMLIELGSNYLFPNYGTSISSLINQRKTSTVMKGLRDEILYALSYVVQINAAETINIQKVISVDIKEGANYYNVTMKLQLTNGELLTIDKNFAMQRNT